MESSTVALDGSVWPARHRALLGLLVVHAVLLVPFAVLAGHPLGHAVDGSLLLAGLAAAGWRLSGRTARASAVSVGLVTASALVVHLGGGLTVLHFHFFFVVAALALYQSTVPYLLALGLVLADHLAMGLTETATVYDDAFGTHHPMTAALVHAGYVLLVAAANVVAWRWSAAERARAEDLAAREAARVRDGERRLAVLYDNAPVGLYVKDLDRRLTRVNRHLLDLHGAEEDTLLGRRVEDLFDDDAVRLIQAQDAVVLAGGTVETDEVLSVGGVPRSFTSLKFPLRDDAGEVTGIAGIMTDTSERVAVQAQLRASEARLREVFEQGPVPQLVLGLDGRVQQVNPALRALLGEGVADPAGAALQDLVHPEDRAAVHLLLEALRAPDPGQVRRALRVLRHGQEPAHCDVTLAVVPATPEAPAYAIGMVQDVTTEHRATEELRRQALQDALTGLANRTLLHARLEEALAQPDRTVAVLFLDLDGFKEVNDSLGHDAGDLLLQAVADRLASHCRAGDTLARLGGDEFVLCCPDLDDDAAAQALSERVLGSLRAPVLLRGVPVAVRGSVGCARGRAADGATPVLLLRDADTALYAAKAAGRDRAVLFVPQLRERAERRRRLESALGAALQGPASADGLALVYQPVVDLRTGRPDVLEALLRFRSPEDGPVAPEEVLAVAAGCGRLAELDRWVLAQACTTAAAWRAPDGSPVRVAVNVSPTSVDDSLVADVVRACAGAALAPSRLTVELTETAVVEHPVRTSQVLGRLRELGVRVALDDFGTGYSSLSHLRELPVDVVKVDRTFIEDLTTSPRDAALVRATVDLARALGARVVAEGVAGRAQLDAVRDAGCDAVQGYWLSRPVPPEAVPALLAGVPLPAPRTAPDSGLDEGLDEALGEALGEGAGEVVPAAT